MPDRLVAGDCLIAEAGGTGTPDASVRLIRRYWDKHYPQKPPEGGPSSIESVKDLHIERREADGSLTAVLQHTETVAETTALPFYVGSEMHMQGGYNGPTIGRQRTVTKPIDLAQTLRATFGYKVDAVAPPAARTPLEIVENILARSPTNVTFSAPQQQVINDLLQPLAGKPSLTDADITLVRRVIADERIDSGQIGATFLTMFRRHGGALAALIPLWSHG